MDEETAREALGGAVALWEVRTTFGPGEVIVAATDALVAGVDSPTLRELAGASAPMTTGRSAQWSRAHSRN